MQTLPNFPELLNRAIEIALQTHWNQVDRGGHPYILHVLRVMFNSQAGPYEQIAAVLHDVIEDGKVTLDDLRMAGFPQVIVDAVDSLSRRKGESRMQAAARAAANPIALKVKLADNADNMDLTRIPHPTQKDLDLVAGYASIRALLLSALVAGTINIPKREA